MEGWVPRWYRARHRADRGGPVTGRDWIGLLAVSMTVVGSAAAQVDSEPPWASPSQDPLLRMITVSVGGGVHLDGAPEGDGLRGDAVVGASTARMVLNLGRTNLALAGGVTLGPDGYGGAPTAGILAGYDVRSSGVTRLWPPQFVSVRGGVGWTSFDVPHGELTRWTFPVGVVASAHLPVLAWSVQPFLGLRSEVRVSDADLVLVSLLGHELAFGDTETAVGGGGSLGLHVTHGSIGGQIAIDVLAIESPFTGDVEWETTLGLRLHGLRVLE